MQNRKNAVSGYHLSYFYDCHNKIIYKMQEELHPLLLAQEKAEDYVKKCTHYICGLILERILSFVDKTPALDNLEPVERGGVKNKLYLTYKNYCFQSEIRVIIEKDNCVREERQFPDSAVLLFKVMNEQQDDKFEESFLQSVCEQLGERNQGIIEKERKRIDKLKNQNKSMRFKSEANIRLIQNLSKENASLKAKLEQSKGQVSQADQKLLKAMRSSLE